MGEICKGIVLGNKIRGFLNKKWLMTDEAMGCVRGDAGQNQSKVV